MGLIYSPLFIHIIKTNFQILVTIIIFFFLEKIRPVQDNQPSSSYYFNFSYFFLTSSMLFWIGPQIDAQLQQLINFIHGGWIVLPEKNNWYTTLLISLLFAFVWDFFQYWMHRAEHTFPVLWEVHKMHHSDEYVNSSTSTRNHLFSFIVNYFLITFPLSLLFKNLIPSIYMSFILFQLWGYFNHMNCKLDMKWLTFIFSGPQWHRTHHSIHETHYNKNYAAFFPILDLIFSTFYLPKKNEFPKTGLAEAINFNQYRIAFFYPFINGYLFCKKIMNKQLKKE